MSSNRPPGRLGRIARLGGLTSRVSSSYLGQRVVGAFQDEAARKDALDRLHRENAERLVATMGSLKGAAMKVGQSISVMAVSLELPAEITGVLERLTDRAEPIPFDVVRAVVERELEGSIDTLFSDFSPVPLGTASLAQAHAATLPDGRPVVVKVLHPGIERSVDTDLAALRSLLLTGRVLRRDPREVDEIFDEIRERLHEELDYYQEAANIEFFAGALAHLDGVRVPRTHPSRCTARVLTMDRVHGVPASAFLASAGREERQRAGTLLCTTFYTMLFGLRTLHADPHAGNYLFRSDGGIGIVDFGCVKRFDPWFVAEYARIGRAIVAGDREATAESARRMGVLVDATPEAEAVLWEFCRAITAPLRFPYYSCGTPEDDVLERVRRIVPQLLRHPSVHSPRELVFLHRTLGGIYAMLRRLRHGYAYHDLFRRFALHAVAVGEGRIDEDAPVAEQEPVAGSGP